MGVDLLKWLKFEDLGCRDVTFFEFDTEVTLEAWLGLFVEVLEVSGLNLEYITFFAGGDWDKFWAVFDFSISVQALQVTVFE